MQARSNHAGVVLLAALILLLGTGVRLGDLDVGGLWADEFLTSRRADSSLPELIDKLGGFANQTPLYYMVLLPFPTHDDLLLRYPNVLIGMVGMALMIGILRRLYRAPRLALWAGLLLALNPYHIWMSRTARAYPLVVVMSLLVSYLFLRVLTGKPTWRAWLAFGIASIAAYQTHFFLLLLPVVQFVMLALYLRDDRGRFWRWVAVQAVAGSLMLAWVVYHALQPAVAIEADWISDTRLADLPLTLWNLSIGYPLDAPWTMGAGAALAIALMLWGSVAVLRHYRGDPQRVYWLLLLWLPLLLVFAISVTVRPMYVDRYFAIILPGVVIMLVWGLHHLPRTAGQAALIVLLAVIGANLVREFARDDHIRTDWRAVVHHIERAHQPGEGIVLPKYFSILERYASDPAALEAVHATAQETLSGPVLELNNATGPHTFSALWVLVDTQYDHIHRTGRMPEHDPFAESEDALFMWIQAHQDQIAERWYFNGGWLFYVQLDDPLHVAASG